MPRYYGPALALSTLANTLNSAFTGAAAGQEDRYKRAMREQEMALRQQQGEREQARLGIEQQRVGLEGQRFGLERERANRPQTFALGDQLLSVDPRGQVSSVYQRPPSFTERYNQTRLAEAEEAKQRRAKFLGDVERAEKDANLPLSFRTLLGAAKSNPDLLEKIYEHYARAQFPSTRTHAPNIHYERDDKGNVTQFITEPDETGKLATRTRGLGQFGRTAASASSGTPFTPQAVEMHAQAVADGAPMPALGMGKASTEARIAISNRAAEIRRERGDTAGSLAIRQAQYHANKTALASLSRQEAQIIPFSRTAHDSLVRARELSDTIDRTGVPVVNRWIMAGRKKVAGDPDVAAFDYHLRLGINEVAKITSSATGGGGVVSDTARKEIEEVISNAMTQEQIRRVIEGAEFEMASRVSRIKEEKAAIHAAMRGEPEPTPAPTKPMPSQKTSGKREAVAPDGKVYRLPEGTDLSTYPGWTWR